MTNNIIVYSSNFCHYCVQAKKLLERLNLSYQEINIQNFPEKRDEMLSKSNGKRTVPQIFVNDYHVGGYDELNSLVQKGEFDSILMNE
jgi:glutaredoxin 3